MKREKTRRRSAARITRTQITARNHKDLSTSEIESRIAALSAEQAHADSEVRVLEVQLRARRAQSRNLAADLQGLQSIIESRR